MELPLRSVGAPCWPKVAKHGRKVRREEMIRARQLREQQRVLARQQAEQRLEQAKKQVELAASAEDPEVAEWLGSNRQN